jgi:hypothetical protein
MNVDSPTIKSSRKVIDTLLARKLFDEQRINIEEKLESTREKIRRLKYAKEAKVKKVTNAYDLNLLSEAYNNYYLTHKHIYADQGDHKNAIDRILPFGLLSGTYNYIIKQKHINADQKGYKNVRKGKITKDVITYLDHYCYDLTDSVRDIEYRIEHNWTSFLNTVPMKTIYFDIPNEYYRGNLYNNYTKLNIIDMYKQNRNWEFLYRGTYTCKSENYPNEVNYMIYDDAPQYKVTYSKEYGYIHLGNVFDKNGILAYVPSLTRDGSSIFDDIKNRVYIRDYQRNRYNIQSKSEHTQTYIKQELGLIPKGGALRGEAMGAIMSALMSEYAYQMGDFYHAITLQEDAMKTAARERNRRLNAYDENGARFISQIYSDHEHDFDCIYIIERVSNVAFRVVYLNEKTMKPSVCAIVTYRTGKNPFTTVYSVKLTEVPKINPIR